MIKLVLCDMDGTLKPFGRDRVSGRSVRAIHELRAAGIQFGPATGREAVDLYPFFGGDESCFAMGILANGKQVYVDGELVLERPLDLPALKRLEAYCLDNPDFALVVYAPAGEKCGRPTADVILSGTTEREVEAYGRRTGLMVSEGRRLGHVPDAKIVTAGFAYMGESAEPMGAIRNDLRERFPEFDFVRPSPQFFDVLPRGWNKATALAPLLERLGITRDEVAFFGDSENDVALMGEVAHSFAVSNASTVARSAARYRIGDAADDSVAKVMEAIARPAVALEIPEDALPR